MVWLRQFGLLLWKNWLLQKRKKVLTAFEIGLPALFALILLLIRQRVEAERVLNITTWNTFDIGDTIPPELKPPGALTWAIAYNPDTQLTTSIMNKMAGRLGLRTDGYGFDTESDMEVYITTQNLTSLDVLMGITFVNLPTNPGNPVPAEIQYKIRPRAEQYNSGGGGAVRFYSASDWFTSTLYPYSSRVGPRARNSTDGGKPGYYQEGFLHMQRALDMAILQELNSTADLESITIKLKRHPYPPYVDDPFVAVLQNQFPFILLLSFIVIAPNIVKDIVLEKERKLKESMKLMGLSSWLHWLAWFLKYFCFLTVSIAIMTFFFHLDVGRGALINYTHFTITFVFLMLYSIATIMFCFAISTFFSKASAGAAAGGILYLITYIPFFFVQYQLDEVTASQRAGMSFISNLGMAFGCVEIATQEAIGTGVQWSNIATPVNADTSFTMMHVFIILILDTLIYGLITWYCDAVLPGDFGVPKPLYFPFTKSYWCGNSLKSVDDNPEEALDYSKVPGISPEYFESAPTNIIPGIKIRNLRKEFKKEGKTKVAVNDMCLDMYEGQITSLLGHNGAGKTTTMFMLTGFIPPTSGTASVNGHDIKKDIEGVRSSLGLCPQHDILFDTLTVHEHLTFFAKLKGCPDHQVKDEVADMIKVLRLTDKRDVFAHKLSGGMKRKLSVGIALIAGSKIVILDEPTSGMDPEARRQTWEILQSQRAGRTMILSTHFMDEADLLGDRIGIMADGVLQCYGTSLFLKNKYGVGYHMVMVKEAGCDHKKVTEVISKYVPNAKLESNISAELSYVLPHESSHCFEELFSYLESNSKALKIASFGASVTTMEEVFLKVGESVDEELEAKLQAQVSEIQNKTQYSSHTFLNKGYEADPETGVTLEKVTLHTDSLPPFGTVDQDNENHLFNNMVTPTDDIALENVTAAQIKQNMSGLSNGATANGVSHQSIHKTLSIEDDLPPVFGLQVERNIGSRLLMQQFRAMLVKRIIHSWRNIVVTLVQILVPLVFTIIGCAVLETFPGPREPPPLDLELKHWEYATTPYIAKEFTNDDYAESLSKAYANYTSKHSLMENVGDNPDFNDLDLYLSNVAQRNFDRFNKEYMVAATFLGKSATTTGPNKSTVAIGHFNNQAYHTNAISLNLLDNALVRYFTNGLHSIVTTNHPLPRTTDTVIQDELNTNLVFGFIVSWNVSFGMAFLVGTFVVFIIKERAVKSKHVQFVSGVHVANYWISTFIWDFINFLIPSLLLLIVFAAFNIRAYNEGYNLGYVFLIFLFYAWSVLPFIYLLSFFFTVASTGYVWITVLNIFTGTAAILAVVILSYPDLGTMDISIALEWVFYVILPNFCFGNALDALYANQETMLICSQIDEIIDGNANRDQFCRLLEFFNATNPCCRDNCGEFCAEWQENVLAWESPGIGRALVFMAIQGIIFFAILFFIESGKAKVLYQKMTTSPAADANEIQDETVAEHVNALSVEQLYIEEDSDVTEEATRISQTPHDDLIQTDSLIIKELSKSYGPLLAVDSLSVGIPQGECFGLLGVNGAGKTSTFKMLTGDESVTSGHAYLGGYSVIDNIKQVRQLVGYCPQFDALVDQMTVRETLRMFARLRGVQEGYIDEVIQTLINSLLLHTHADKQAGQLSGGNKRKLSTAIALVGDPPVVFLDEPTTGMDPVARRLLWDTLTKVRRSGRTLILTSHSMEECEALCTRLAIMVNGKFRCLGSPQHLKNKFGEGYTVLAKVQAPDLTATATTDTLESRTQQLRTFIEDTFPGSTLKDLHMGMVHYQVPSDNLTWANIFGTMERARQAYHIEDYSVSQTTLEQVFLSFARAQLPPREEGVKCKTKCANCCRFFCCCGCCKV